MAALAVAPPAGGELVLDPARAALDPGDQMLGRRPDQPDVERPPAPDARGPVAIEDPLPDDLIELRRRASSA